MNKAQNEYDRMGCPTREETKSIRESYELQMEKDKASVAELLAHNPLLQVMQLF
jgi:hypothetical protein